MNPQIVPRYPTSVAAKAVGESRTVLDHWCARRVFRMEPNDEDAAGHGRPRRWSRRTIQKLGIMSALTAIGLTPARAHSASEFALREMERCPVEGGRMYLAVQGSKSRLFILPQGQNFEDAFNEISDGVGSAAAIVDLTRTFSKIDSVLDTMKD